MNKLSKLGVSALCGSLAAISTANAGDLTVTGGVHVTWLSKEDAVTGNPIGMVQLYHLKVVVSLTTVGSCIDNRRKRCGCIFNFKR